ncbi:MAG TPA: aspartate aminotransferase family protein [Candidatus Sulfotelmatobacter sp.]|nr:aspartate aminotransferase family protein [Candidatus Sulfotelmatobacter sp.]
MFESEFLTSTEDSKQAYRGLIARVAEIVCESFPDQPYSGKTPAALAEAVGNDFLPQRQRSLEEIANTLRTVVSYSIAVSNPMTAAHLHCPPLLAALAAEVVISALNQSMDSFDQAPIATVVEQKTIRWLCTEARLPAAAAGTFTTGGSQSNYMGLLLARDAFLQRHWNWSAQKSGLPSEARRIRILCSEAAHFTVEKSASQLGLGTDAVVRVPVDDHFRMKTSSLRSSLEALKTQGLFPMAIVATAGTTDFGSIDPLPEIAAVSSEASAWLHVDAAYGGALLFSARHRSRLAGIEHAHSIAIDFHKLFWQPIPCSAFLVRDARHFDAMKLYADYLNPEFHEDDGIPNLVTSSLLTSRRFDALKLWISFQTLGREKLAAMIDRAIALANHAATVVRASRDVELVCEPQLSTIVFRYISSGLESDTDRINREIPQKLFDRGVAVIGRTRVHGRHCLKLTCMNPTTTEADMDKLIELISSQGRDCAP